MFEGKNRVFEFNCQKMNIFEFIQCLKNNFRACLMNDLVNLVKASKLRCFVTVCSKPEFRFSSSIINRLTCSSSFDVR